ncbi:MAG: HesA/MoeB/ThiF family protein [Candidatus Binatia bacterium]
MLTDGQIERYSRQIILPQLGGRGQEKLLSAAIAVAGTGDMSISVALYLAAAGVGTLGVDAPAAAAIAGLNPDCRTQSLPAALDADRAAAAARNYDLLLAADLAPDACSALNVACMAVRKQLVWGAATGHAGRVAVFTGHRPAEPCYACQPLPLPPARGQADDAAVLASVTAAFIGTLLATETIKLAAGIETPLTKRLLVYDALDATVRALDLHKDPHCAACGGVNRAEAVCG